MASQTNKQAREFATKKQLTGTCLEKLKDYKTTLINKVGIGKIRVAQEVT